MSASIVSVQEHNWKSEVVDSQLPVLVDFWAEWCGPCKAMESILEELSGELNGKMKIVKIDVGENQQLAGNFGIRSLPTLLVLKQGIVQGQMGAMNKEALTAKVSSYL